TEFGSIAPDPIPGSHQDVVDLCTRIEELRESGAQILANLNTNPITDADQRALHRLFSQTIDLAESLNSRFDRIGRWQVFWLDVINYLLVAFLVVIAGTAGAIGVRERQAVERQKEALQNEISERARSQSRLEQANARMALLG